MDLASVHTVEGLERQRQGRGGEGTVGGDKAGQSEARQGLWAATTVLLFVPVGLGCACVVRAVWLLLKKQCW